MGNLNEIRLRAVPEELFNWLKAEADRKGMSLSALLLSELWWTKEGRWRDRNGTGTGQLRDSLSHARKLESSEKTGKTDAERDRADTRHKCVRELIMKVHEETFKTECPWGPGEAGQLGQLLKAVPEMTVDELAVCVRNRFRSEGISPERPMGWIGNLTRYGAGPLDKFGKTKRALKPAPVKYLEGMYSAETMEKIRQANEE